MAVTQLRIGFFHISNLKKFCKQSFLLLFSVTEPAMSASNSSSTTNVSMNKRRILWFDTLETNISHGPNCCGFCFYSLDVLKSARQMLHSGNFFLSNIFI